MITQLCKPWHVNRGSVRAVGLIAVLVLAAPPGFSDDTASAAQRVSEQLAVSEHDGRPAATVDQTRTDIQSTIDDFNQRPSTASGQSDSLERAVDEQSTSTGSLLAGVLVAGLLLLAAVNGRKRPLRTARNARHAD